jgi:hypothetical protein
VTIWTRFSGSHDREFGGVGQSALEGSPALGLIGAPFGAAKDAGGSGVIDGGLDAQPPAELVIHLQGVGSDAMLEANAFGADVEVGQDLAGELGMDWALEVGHFPVLSRRDV